MSQSQTAYANTSPFTATWQQYQDIRLSRLQQQRQRMSTMQQALERYTQIIAEMQQKNITLVTQNEEIRKQNHKLKLSNHQLEYQIEELKIEVGKEAGAREGLEIVIARLKGEIDGRVNPGVYSYQYQYETLQELYESLKNQYYLKTKQNLQLKQVIKQQSQLHISHRVSGPLSPKQKSSSNTGRIKQAQQSNLPPDPTFHPQPLHHPHPHPQPISPSPSSSQSQKIRMLKLQLKYQMLNHRKMQQLIDKFKENEEQQQKLIELLKNSSNRVCGCHLTTISKSSKKILSINAIEADRNGKN